MKRLRAHRVLAEFSRRATVKAAERRLRREQFLELRDRLGLHKWLHVARILDITTTRVYRLIAGDEPRESEIAAIESALASRAPSIQGSEAPRA